MFFFQSERVLFCLKSFTLELYFFEEEVIN